MRTTEWNRRALLGTAVLIAAGFTGCKSLNERYIALEVWKYEKCFGHLPPGFVPPGAQAAMAPAMRPCGQPANCGQATPCQSASFAPGGHVAGGDCNECQGAVVEGGMPMGAGGTVMPGLPAGPGGAPGPMPSNLPSPVSTSKPVIISDEVVLP
jgi:hypothetical protein